MEIVARHLSNVKPSAKTEFMGDGKVKTLLEKFCNLSKGSLEANFNLKSKKTLCCCEKRKWE